jgi:hypothetical protein
MPRNIVLDEIHLTVTIPRGLEDAIYDSAHIALMRRSFLASLRRAIQEVFRRHPSLTRVRFAITR